MVKWYAPTSLQEALELKASYDLIPYAGGTDIMMMPNQEAGYLFVKNIPEMRKIVTDEQYVRIGAAVTFTEALAHPDVPALMKEALSSLGSPAVRNAGTFGGNLGNGSDKGDSVLIEFAADAKIRLASKEGERILDIDKFHIKRKELDLRKDELIVEVLLPKQGLEQYYFKKVGGRSSNAMSITFVSFAGVFGMEDGKITHVAAVFGAAGDAIQRYKDIEKMLIGKTLEEASAMKEEYLKAYADRLLYNQSRVGPDYQRFACAKLLEDFLTTNGI